MCGIFGYIGEPYPLAGLFQGLYRLEYRGYDSCGLAFLKGRKIFLKKQSGKISGLEKELGPQIKERVSLGIFHSRWATHGAPTRINAHPHLDCQKRLALVHNGIIENAQELKEKLIEKGHKFLSETDTEVIVHLIEEAYSQKQDIEKAFLKIVAKLKGSFAIAVFSQEEKRLLCARKGSPLILGFSSQGNFLASDVPALLPFTQKMIYLDEAEVAILEPQDFKISDFKGKVVRKKPQLVKIREDEVRKEGFSHFMLKEIFEQPKILERIFSLYLKKDSIYFPDLGLREPFLGKIKKIYIVACGTAYHAGYVGKYFLEGLTDLEIEIDVSSEFRYRSLNLNRDSLAIVISQSGETADTLAALRRFKKEKTRILAICNVLGSSLVREAEGLIYTAAGPEIGVASTKAFTAQIACLFLFSLYLGLIRGSLDRESLKRYLRDFRRLASSQRKVLSSLEKIRKIAGEFSKFGCFLFLGRGINYPLALEGALKLKEISYIPAEGYPAGEMKHGPIALIDEYRAVICMVCRGSLFDKMVSNIQEIKARRGKVLIVADTPHKKIESLADECIYVPSQSEFLFPSVAVVALQLFAYFIAKNLGCEIDQPRNLAKSVTVE